VPESSAELFDPTTSTFAAIDNMTTARVLQTATLLEKGQVLIVGGLGSDATLATAELYTQ
jgi:type II secretory pathway component GspD/PulD (secretin)